MYFLGQNALKMLQFSIKALLRRFAGSAGELTALSQRSYSWIGERQESGQETVDEDAGKDSLPMPTQAHTQPRYEILDKTPT